MSNNKRAMWIDSALLFGARRSISRVALFVPSHRYGKLSSSVSHDAECMAIEQRWRRPQHLRQSEDGH